MKAIHGGKAKNDKIDSHKIAALLRGGMLPQAYAYPAPMRATRDLLRRRTHLMRKRAELLSHVQNTNSQYNLPAIGKKIAYKANRYGVAERFAQAAVQKTIEVDLASLPIMMSCSKTWSARSSKPPSTTMPTPCICCQPYQGLARFSASCGSMKSTVSTAFPAYKSSPHTPVWSNAAKNQVANVWAPQGKKSATRTSSGPFPKRPLYSCVTTLRARNFWPAWRKNMIKAKP